MDRVFSVEEIPSTYRAPPQPQAASATGATNGCPSERYLQRFLEEEQAVLDGPPGPGTGGGGSDAGAAGTEPPPPVGRAPSSEAVDPAGYDAAMLKQKLDEDLAAVAMWRASRVMPPERSAAGSSSLQNGEVSRAGPPNSVGGNGIPVANELAGGPTAGLGPQVVQNVDILVKQATSSSSQQSDDDMEGEAETTGNANPVQQRLQRRKQSNRESARRSRSRKAAHLNELEAEVAQLRVENSSLLGRLADANQKFNDASVDNRVLKADVETLRAKVKMAEDSVKRATGMNDLYPAVSDMSSLSMPFQGSPSDSTSDAAVPIQDDPNSYFASPNEIQANNNYMPDIVSSTQEHEDFINPTPASGKMGRTESLQRVASLEHLQKRMCGGLASSGSTS